MDRAELIPSTILQDKDTRRWIDSVKVIKKMKSHFGFSRKLVWSLSFSALLALMGPTAIAFELNSNAETWANLYSYEVFGGVPNATFISATITSDQGYILSSGSVVSKLDKSGQVQWSNNYLCGPCAFQSIVEGRTGGYFSVNDWSSSPGNFVFVYRMDEMGNVKWSKSFSRARISTAHVVINTRDGGYLVGAASGNSLATRQMWLIKLGGNGALQWQRSYNLVEPTSISQLSNGDYLVGTRLLSVLRLSPGGNVRWQRRYLDAGSGVMRITGDGGFVLGGRSEKGALIIEADSQGVVEFAGQFNGEALIDVRPTKDDGYVLLTKRLTGRLLISKLTSKWAVAWRKAVTVPGQIAATQLLQTADQGFVLATYEGVVLKMDASGNVSNSCSNILTPTQGRLQSISVTVEKRNPTVSRIPIVVRSSTENAASPIRTIVESLCTQ